MSPHYFASPKQIKNKESRAGGRSNAVRQKLEAQRAAESPGRNARSLAHTEQLLLPSQVSQVHSNAASKRKRNPQQPELFVLGWGFFGLFVCLLFCKRWANSTHILHVMRSLRHYRRNKVRLWVTLQNTDDEQITTSLWVSLGRSHLLPNSVHSFLKLFFTPSNKNWDWDVNTPSLSIYLSHLYSEEAHEQLQAPTTRSARFPSLFTIATRKFLWQPVPPARNVQHTGCVPRWAEHCRAVGTFSEHRILTEIFMAWDFHSHGPTLPIAPDFAVASRRALSPPPCTASRYLAKQAGSMAQPSTRSSSNQRSFHAAST